MRKNFIYLLPVALCFQSVANESKNSIETALNRIVKADNLTLCTPELISIGNDLIGDKKHRLINTSTGKNTISISGILNYNDRPSHLSFFVHKDEEGKCVVHYQLSYHFDVSCLEVREGGFKKWNHQGDFSATTKAYKHKRDGRKTAHLSNVSHGTQCLVNTHFDSSALK